MSQNTIGKWFDERIEMFLDGELPENEARLFSAELAVNPALAAEVERATAITSHLRDMPSYRSPVDLADRLERMVGAEPPKKRRWIPAALAASVAAICAVGIAWNLQPNETRPNAEELAAAERDLAVVMAYLDHAGDVASRSVGETVVEQGILQSVSGGINEGLRRRQESS